MISERFNRLFDRLVVAFTHHQDVPRRPGNVPELGAARWDLELARAAIARERERMAGQTRPRIPRQTAASDGDIARLRAFGAGYVSG